jgi:hypothetical protein
MAFTYDITTNRGKCRFAIGDYTASSGILPSGGNFTDAEVDAATTLCGNWQSAAVYLLRAAATQWSTQATSKSIGNFSFSRETAQRLSDLADKLANTLPGAWSGMGLGASTADNIAVVE